jgi:hypothetical protein
MPNKVLLEFWPKVVDRAFWCKNRSSAVTSSLFLFGFAFASLNDLFGNMKVAEFCAGGKAKKGYAESGRIVRNSHRVEVYSGVFATGEYYFVALAVS